MTLPHGQNNEVLVQIYKFLYDYMLLKHQLFSKVFGTHCHYNCHYGNFHLEHSKLWPIVVQFLGNPSLPHCKYGLPFPIEDEVLEGYYIYNFIIFEFSSNNWHIYTTSKFLAATTLAQLLFVQLL